MLILIIGDHPTNCKMSKLKQSEKIPCLYYKVHSQLEVCEYIASRSSETQRSEYYV